MKKVYYQLKMIQKSPLRVGNGDGKVTDSDLMVDGKGCPFIPGSSVAGVLRDLCASKIPSISEETKKELFGYIDGEKLSDSHMLVSDAVGPKQAIASDYIVTVRDGIRLDEWGITVNGNKYDFQVAETNQPYYSVVEWTGDDDSYQKEVLNGLDILVKSIVADGISFGARTTRGYGRMSVTARKKVFEFPRGLDEWLEFDPLNENSFEDGNDVEGESAEDTVMTICADLVMKGSFSVRVNTARAEVLADGSIPDSIPLSNSAGKTVIPGHSWAGVFRHHMLALLRQAGLNQDGTDRTAKLNRLFGMEEKEGNHLRSSIRFAETEISGGSPYSIMRNAVERFTQAPRNTALFTDRFWQGGSGNLEIRIDLGRFDKLQTQLLAISLIDLDLGLLTFGGASGMGHGRCEISKITVDGKDITDQLKRQNSHFLEEFL